MARRLDTGRTGGGICRLREIVSEYPAEIAYDFRHRFNLSIFDIGDTVSWPEAILLLSVLLQDTSSWTQAAMSDWKYPVSREWIVAAHTFDLLAQINSKKKPKAYPAPWPDTNVKKIGSGKANNNKVREFLERMNPKGE